MKLRSLLLFFLAISLMLPVQGSIQHTASGCFTSLIKPITHHSTLKIAVGCACATALISYCLYTYWYGKPAQKHQKRFTSNTYAKNKKRESTVESTVVENTPHQALLQAAAQGDIALMKKILVANKGTLLLNAVEERTGHTLLHKAAMSGKLDACRFLLQFNKVFEQHEVGLNKKDLSGNTPLHVAISSMNRQCEEIVTLFIRNGADALIQNNDGNTALHEAVAWSAYNSIIALLIACKNIDAFLSIQNNEHRTAVQLAHRNTDKDAILALFTRFLQLKEKKTV